MHARWASYRQTPLPAHPPAAPGGHTPCRTCSTSPCSSRRARRPPGTGRAAQTSACPCRAWQREGGGWGKGFIGTQRPAVEATGQLAQMQFPEAVVPEALSRCGKQSIQAVSTAASARLKQGYPCQLPT